MQRNKISFKGQKIFIGIDVHKTTWEVAVLTESGLLRRHSQESSAKVLFDFLSLLRLTIYSEEVICGADRIRVYS